MPGTQCNMLSETSRSYRVLLVTNCSFSVPQDLLNSKGFGTDLPLVNSQVEEHNIFHNEVMAIGPHISKEGDKVESISPSCPHCCSVYLSCLPISVVAHASPLYLPCH